MKFFKNAKYLLSNPSKIVEFFLQSTFIKKIVSDKRAISIIYKNRFRRKMNWDAPKSLNEKLLWLTVYDRNPIYNIMVDKYEAKQWISEQLIKAGLPTDCIIPTIGVYDKFDEIDFNKLPNQFVIKATHDSGTVVVCQDKNLINLQNLKNKIEKGLKHNYYWFSREWAYKNVKPRIIIEKKIESQNGVPEDFKIFCFNGKAKFWFYASDRDTHVKFDFYDMDWNKLPFKQGHPSSDKIIKKPDCWDEMVNVAELLSKDLPHLRVDFFIDVYGNFFVGELTLTHFSGLVPFEPEEWDEKLGEYLVLPKI